jgi:hypothetical protein
MPSILHDPDLMPIRRLREVIATWKRWRPHPRARNVTAFPYWLPTPKIRPCAAPLLWLQE